MAWFWCCFFFINMFVRNMVLTVVDCYNSYRCLATNRKHNTRIIYYVVQRQFYNSFKRHILIYILYCSFFYYNSIEKSGLFKILIIIPTFSVCVLRPISGTFCFVNKYTIMITIQSQIIIIIIIFEFILNNYNPFFLCIQKPLKCKNI